VKGALPIAALLAAGCSEAASERNAPGAAGASSARADGSAPAAASIFRDVTSEVRLSFRHRSGATGRYDMPEVIGSGGAVLDADEDGRLDLYLLGGGRVLPSDDTPIAPNRLYLQQADGAFLEATERIGAAPDGYGTGCAVGDVDNDGHEDLFVACVGPDSLLLGRGDGSFRDAAPGSATSTAPISTAGSSTAGRRRSGRGPTPSGATAAAASSRT
jgi:hypothetical protein